MIEDLAQLRKKEQVQDEQDRKFEQDLAQQFAINRRVSPVRNRDQQSKILMRRGTGGSFESISSIKHL